MRFPFTIPEKRKFDAVGFGTNAVDHLINVPQFPRQESKVEYTAHTILPGGEIASTMVGLQRLGFKTAYAGRFGNDAAGEIGISSLVDEGVDVSSCQTTENAETQSAFIFIDERTGERTILWRRDEKLSYLAQDAPTQLAADARVLHMTPHDTDACIAMAQVARENGTIVSLDIDNIFNGTENLLPLVDILLASADFAKRMTGIDDLRDGLSQINKNFRCAVVGSTLGAKGSLILCGGEFLETAAFDVPGGCQDTTGAGDAFRTGFLFGVLSGMSVDESARSANAVAALKCRKIGARTALPTTEELNDVLA